MRFWHRPFDSAGNNDFRNMLCLVIDDAAARGDDFVWQPGRLVDWHYGLWTDRKRIPDFFAQHAELWFDGLTGLAGFVLSENGDGDVAILVGPGYEFLRSELAAWAAAAWIDRWPALAIEARETDDAWLKTLGSVGFESRGRVATTRTYDLAAQTRVPIRIPDGLSIADMASSSDYVAKRTLQVNAFQGYDIPTEADLWAGDHVRTSPIYDASLDLSVVDTQGRHLASCEAFVDYPHQLVEVERICTHSDHRRRGLAEAVVRTCFQRLFVRGLRTAHITGFSQAANGLYEKLGAVGVGHWQALTLKGATHGDL